MARGASYRHGHGDRLAPVRIHAPAKRKERIHELSITESILRTALAEAEKAKAQRIKRIKLKVGEATMVVPDCLQFYFSTLRAGTCASTAELEIETVPLCLRCPRCGQEFRGLEVTCVCAAGATVQTGQELLIEYLEVE